MGAERHEEGAREAAQEMEHDAERMDEELDRLGEHIGDAEKAAANRPEAGSDVLEDVADPDERDAGA
jgi:hypothetical protein